MAKCQSNFHQNWDKKDVKTEISKIFLILNYSKTSGDLDLGFFSVNVDTQTKLLCLYIFWVLWCAMPFFLGQKMALYKVKLNALQIISS